ncbi:MAG TPA: sporulation protein [Firmicutes bacterium]|jgi:homoserine acetyltransferase|nr:sporulation protein [Bacillota bacterium]
MPTYPTLITTFFIALGVILGGSTLGSLAAFLFYQKPPHYTILDLAEKLKIWALVAALGGSFGAFRAIETSFFSGQPAEMLRQLALITSAFCGAHLGYLLLKYSLGGH